MTSNRISSVVIAGGGTAGWMTAAALSKFILPAGVRVELIESDAIGTVGVGEASIPGIADFNRMLGITEPDFIAATRGSYKLGIEFVDWGAIGERYLHPFGDYGFPMQGEDFHHFWNRARLLGEDHALEAYSMCCMAARAGKFMLPVNDPQSPVSQMRHAYHFDAGLYARFLRQYAEARGVVRHEGRIATVERDGERGAIRALGIDDGPRLEADLFVDCTGFRGLLIGQELGVAYQDWREWLPCDRAIALPSERDETTPPYTRATAREAGWQWRIPLQHRVGNGYVYSSAHTDDERALDVLTRNIEGTPLAEPNHLRFTPGRRDRFWEKNCVAIGLSSGFLEPLESTSIHLIQEGVSKLLALFPRDGISARETARYNAIMADSFDYIRDFLILHYNATRRNDSAFWDHVRTMQIPDSLSQTLGLFRENGRFFAHKGDLFTLTSWLAVMVGQGILPKAYSPVADSLASDELARTLRDMRETYAMAASKMPPHDAFIRHVLGKAETQGELA
ncbi:tryptophan halogenase family protein [Maricaulis sp.]|uniref:tryptophan halogenase family protein n=1 Tax=Maricaulis sp. TaxID=1486257 RepID=UPI001B124141|nr:tryptophan halogenase family protein [Maricaulis sp.]MBO6795915.1 tryptophan 7-halogenase [Maricaulis sp.]